MNTIVPKLSELSYMPAWKRPLYRDSIKWMVDGSANDEITFFEKWRKSLDDYRKTCRAWSKQWRIKNRDKLKAALKKRYYSDVERSRAYARIAREKRKNDPVRLEAYRKYCREKMAERLATDVNFRIRFRTRNRIWMSLQRGVAKVGGTVEMIGCTIPEYKAHIESLWKPGMTWDNYGRGKCKWHIDHIKPCSSFDLTKLDEQKKCFHFSNTQPLWEFENLSKGDNYETNP